MRNNRQVGSEKESLAAAYLQKQGVEILHMNFRCRQGEIDLIGRDGEYLVFFEVKFRSSQSKGYSFDAVHYKKQRIICRVSDYFRVRYAIKMNQMVRFDVIGIDKDHIDWMKNAFPYISF